MKTDIGSNNTYTVDPYLPISIFMDIGRYSYIDLYVCEAGRKGFGENNKEPSTETGFNPETDLVQKND